MPVSILALAAAAAAHGAQPHAPNKVDAAQARAEGYAEAQRALAGQGSFTPDALAANLASGRQAAPAQPMSSAPAPVQAPASSGGGQLNLTCVGAGTANKVASATAWSSGSFSGHVGYTGFGGSTSGSTTVFGSRQQGFEDQVDIRLFGGDDRIRMPRTMLPTLHGGSDGWFKLKNVKSDAREIHASVAVNFINNPKVYIDRVTGTISISGKAGDYSGQCGAVPADAVAKF